MNFSLDFKIVILLYVNFKIVRIFEGKVNNIFIFGNES